MEPLYSPGVGYQPCGFPSEEDVWLITWKACCSGTFLGFGREDWICLNPWSPSAPEPSEYWQSCRGDWHVSFDFTCFIDFCTDRIDQVVLPAMELCPQVSYLMWPTLQKSECSKSVRTSLLWSVWSEDYKHLIFTFSIDASLNSGNRWGNWAGLW